MTSLSQQNKYVDFLYDTLTGTSRKNLFSVFTKTGRFTKSYKSFIKSNGGIFDDTDLLQPLNKTFNPITGNSVNRDTVYTKKGKLRKRFEKQYFKNQVNKYDEQLQKVYQKVGNETTIDLTTLTSEALKELIERLDTSKPLVFIVENTEGAKSYYTINEKTLSRLYSTLTGEVQEFAYGSDTVLFGNVDVAKSVTIKHIQQSNKISGAFFKNTLKVNIPDVARFGIYQSIVSSNYDDNCFIKALAESGQVDSEKLNQIRLTVKTRYVPMCKMRTIAEKHNLNIKISGISNTRRVNQFGDKTKPLIHLGLIDNHYFINDKTSITSYALKHYESLKDKKDWNHFVKSNARNSARCISSLEMFRLLTTDESIKNQFLEPITISSELFNTQHYEKIKDFPALDVDESDCVPMSLKDRNKKIEKKKIRSQNTKKIFFDFETNVYTGGKHEPYLCYYIDEDHKTFGFTGNDCGKQMMDQLHARYEPLHTNLLMLAHNLSYDFTTGLIDILHGVETIEKGSSLMMASATFYRYGKPMRFTFHDTYAKIPEPLKKFGKMFKLKQEKEVMPYPLYNTVNISKRYIPVAVCLKYVQKKDHNQYIENCEKWNCIANGLVDIITYSAKYCEIDCIVLQAGYNKFSKMIMDTCQLNVDHYISAASMADDYIISKGCYEGCYELSGVPRAFIQRCLVGGRTMCSENKQQKQIDVEMADFDAVSLYPSAMNRLKGFLMGAPEKINTTNYEQLCKESDGFYIRVRITSVPKHRTFPLLSYVNEDGVRMFTNDMVGRVVYIDDVALFDAVQFQGVTFDIIDGYQFTNGFNTKISKVIKHLFNARVKAKKKKNPVQAIIKLIMNSCYGKTALKEIGEDVVYISKNKFDEYVSRHYSWIKEITESQNGKRLRVVKVKAINEHFNRVHIGIQILSMSKRIMNEVMTLAEDEGHPIYYQDTDSMHIYNEHVSKLATTFRQKYGRELIGKQMGQFHVDFEMEGCDNIYSEKFIALGKKSYIDCLVGTDEHGKQQRGYHIRMKGIPTDTIIGYCKRKRCSPLKLYEDLADGKAVEFNLLEGELGERVRFKKTKMSTMTTLSKFARVVQFKQ